MLGGVAAALAIAPAPDDPGYDTYVRHQSAKLGPLGSAADVALDSRNGTIREYDRKNEVELARRIARSPFYEHMQSPVLCVGARLGGEVRAFNTLGTVDLAVGVDLNPGQRNPFSMWGDAHALYQFKNSSFGTLYSNVIDHIGRADRFGSEAFRVLRAGGTLLVEMRHQRPEDDAWAVHDMTVARHRLACQIEGAGFRLELLHSSRNWARVLVFRYLWAKPTINGLLATPPRPRNSHRPSKMATDCRPPKARRRCVTNKAGVTTACICDRPFRCKALCGNASRSCVWSSRLPRSCVEPVVPSRPCVGAPSVVTGSSKAKATTPGTGIESTGVHPVHTLT